MTEFKQDVLGNKLGQVYSTILTDPTFERRLKAFDPNLKLLFDQKKKKWTILENAPDGSGWNKILVSEDDRTKEPKAVGEWIFERLWEFRNMYEHRHKNPNQYFNDLMYRADQQATEIQRQGSINHKNKLLDDRNEWRRAARELKNLPKSDVTAGYPKNPYGDKNAITSNTKTSARTKNTSL